MFKHLEETKMTYFGHYLRALKFACWSIKMYFVCIIHAVLPCFFEDTFSENVSRLARTLEEEEVQK